MAVLLFGSGCCALAYQIVWLREFRLVFGASTAASAAVLAIFIGGLGFGGLVIGPRADRHPNPLRLYAGLEAVIALSAAATPALFWLVRRAYVILGGTAALGLGGGTVVRLGLAALVLAVPTFLMGGTLPAAARAVAAADDRGRRSVARLYGVNTLGAVAGAFTATFFLIERYGNRRVLWLAALVNLLVAVAANSLAQSSGRRDETPSAADAQEPSAPGSFVLAAAAVVGFVFFLMELVWYRMLGPILGGTVFTFGLILSVALLGIGLGGAACSLRSRQRSATLGGFAATCLLEAALIAVPYALGDRLALIAHLLRPLGSLGVFWGYVSGWAVVCGIVVLPAAMVAGYQFPLLIGLLGQGRHQVGRQTGLAYAWNTLGAMTGSLAGGFGLIPLLSAPGAWRLAAALLLGLGLTALILAARSRRPGLGLAAPASLAVATGLLLSATGPTAGWRHSGIGVGRGPGARSLNEWQDWLNGQRRQTRWEGDGVESSVAVQALGPGLAFVINGKVDGNSRGDASTMIMSGLVGALLHPEPRRSLVIGLGTGETAGWLGSIAGMEGTDVVELEPLVIGVARDCAAVNQRVLQNPRVRIFPGDARELLLVARSRYDLIVSEPSNPYRAGVASLFTREFYQAVDRRLDRGGLFLQWIQAYEVGAETVSTVYATVASVFPHLETWQVSHGDLLLVASREPVVYDVPRLRQRLREEPYAAGARVSWQALDLEGVLAHFVAGTGLARAVAARPGQALNTDDRNLVEFGFARSVGSLGSFGIHQVREAAALRNDDRPPVTGAEVDWSSVEAQRVPSYPPAAQAPLLHQRMTSSQRTLALAFGRFRSGDSAGAASAWSSLGRPPLTLSERLLAASVLAEAGREDALVHVEALRAAEPLMAEGVVAWLRAQQGRTEEAVGALERILAGARLDAWAPSAVVRDALNLSAQIGSREPRFAPRLYAALREPLALQAYESERRQAMADMLPNLALKDHCLTLFDGIEPNVAWSESWLSLRHRCYVATGRAAAARAAEDLRLLWSRRPSGFEAGLGTGSGG